MTLPQCLKPIGTFGAGWRAWLLLGLFAEIGGNWIAGKYNEFL
jgi:hypothetical protein